jgi:hypothetical protein
MQRLTASECQVLTVTLSRKIDRQLGIPDWQTHIMRLRLKSGIAFINQMKKAFVEDLGGYDSGHWSLITSRV